LRPPYLASSKQKNGTGARAVSSEKADTLKCGKLKSKVEGIKHNPAGTCVWGSGILKNVNTLITT
jgi:hypothetical protein